MSVYMIEINRQFGMLQNIGGLLIKEITPSTAVLTMTSLGDKCQNDNDKITTFCDI